MTSNTASSEAGFDPIAQFVKRTGMHAVATVASEKHRVYRGTWIVLMLSAFVMLFAQVISLSLKLASHPTSTKVDVVLNDSIHFPAITFCNLNPAKKTLVEKAYEISKKNKAKIRKKRMLSDETTEYPNMTNRIFDFGDPDDYALYLELEKAIEKRKRNQKKRLNAKKVGGHKTRNTTGLRARITMRQKLIYLLTRLDGKGNNNFKYSLSDMLVDCTFNEEDCDDETHFTRISSPQYGNCFVFNRNCETIFATTRSSRDSGLEMTLFVDGDSYIEDMAQALGYVVVIHPQSRPPIPEEEGFILSPGFLTTFGLKREERYELEYPYGRCKNFTEEDNRRLNMYMNVLPNTKPTIDVCMRTCEQLQIMKRCKCYSIFLGFTDAPAFEEINPSIRQTPCSVDTKDESNKCMKKEGHDIDDYCKKEMCPYEACKGSSFIITQSMAKWPDSMSEESMKLELQHSGNQRMNESTFSGPIFDNLLKFSVSFDDLRIIQYKTEKMYDWLDFLSDLGGQGGLWLGISIFTFCELSILVCELAYMLLVRVIGFKKDGTIEKKTGDDLAVTERAEVSELEVEVK